MGRVRARVGMLVAVLVAVGLGWGQSALAEKGVALVVTNLSEQRQPVAVSPSRALSSEEPEPIAVDPSVILHHSRHRGQVEVHLNFKDPLVGSNPHRGFAIGRQLKRRFHLGGGIRAMRQFNYRLSSDDKSPGLRNLGGYFELAWDF